MAADERVGARESGERRGERTLGEDRLLSAQLLQHLGGAGQAVSALSDRDVERQLLNLERLHGVTFLLREGRRVAGERCGSEDTFAHTTTHTGILSRNTDQTAGQHAYRHGCSM